MSRDPLATCPHCKHFVDWHHGLPFDGGPNGEWHYRCSCGCVVDEELNLLSKGA